MAKTVEIKLGKKAGVAMKNLSDKLKKLEGHTERPEWDPQQPENLARAIASLDQSTEHLLALCRQTWRAKFTVTKKKRSAAKGRAKAGSAGRTRRRATR